MVESTRPKVNKYIRWTVLKSLFSLGLLVWLFLSLNWRDLIIAISTVPTHITGLGILLLVISQAFGAWRLQLLLIAQEFCLSYFYIFRLTLMGLFISNFLPSTMGGDVVKVLILAKRKQVKITPIASVLVDRLLNLLAIVVLFPSVIVLSRILNPMIIQAIGFSLMALIGCGLLAALIYSRRRSASKRVQLHKLESLASSKLQRFREIASQISRRWLDHPKTLLWGLVLSLASVMSATCSIWIASQALNISVNFIEIVAIVVLLYLVTLLPISLNGWGVQEFSIHYLLTQLGATPSQALALAVLARVFYLGTSLLGAFDVLTWRKVTGT